jgi:hypothetical protein
MKIKLMMIMILGIMFYGCTDATRASLGAYGQEHRVRMYNGGVLVAEWISTGKVVTMTESDGWQFMDKASGKLVRVSGDVIIEVVK